MKIATWIDKGFYELKPAMRQETRGNALIDGNNALSLEV
jgi:hypothetical protein